MIAECHGEWGTTGPGADDGVPERAAAPVPRTAGVGARQRAGELDCTVQSGATGPGGEVGVQDGAGGGVSGIFAVRAPLRVTHSRPLPTSRQPDHPGRISVAVPDRLADLLARGDAHKHRLCRCPGLTSQLARRVGGRPLAAGRGMRCGGANPLIEAADVDEWRGR
jgi:hypothetical protein